MPHEPLKRHRSLQPFSHDHHQALLFCRKIRQGISKNIPVQRMGQYANWFWSIYVKPHFELEEDYLFPILGITNEKVQRACSEHKRLQQLFECDSHTGITLNHIEQVLQQHIRFEERDLFQDIQAVADPKQLSVAEQHHAGSFCDDWVDEFWK